VRLWEAGSGRSVATLPRDSTIRVAEFSADGLRLATGSVDGIVRLWDAKTGDPESALLNHEGEIVLLRFAGDGQRVVSASYDGAVRIWDLPLGNEDDAKVIASLIEAVVGYRVNQQGAVVPFENVIQPLETLRKSPSSLASLGARVQQWVLDDRLTRAVRPRLAPDGALRGSGLPTGDSVDAYVIQQLASPDANVRIEAQRLFPWHPRVRASLADMTNVSTAGSQAR
jgi:WD domain, G-beta repeat